MIVLFEATLFSHADTLLIRIMFFLAKFCSRQLVDLCLLDSMCIISDGRYRSYNFKLVFYFPYRCVPVPSRWGSGGSWEVGGMGGKGSRVGDGIAGAWNGGAWTRLDWRALPSWGAGLATIRLILLSWG